MSLRRNIRGGFRRGQAPSSVPYDPATESGLVLDLWAEAGISEAGTGVASWLDRVGSVDFVQATDGKRPTYEASGLGGQPSVLGVAANADALVAAAFANASTDWTLIAFCDPITATGGTRYILDSQLPRLIFCQSANAANVGYYDGAFKSIAAETTGPQVLTWSLEDGVGGEILRGGSSIGTGLYTARTISGAMGVFAATAGAQNANIRIGRLMLFSTIDAARDARVRQWGSDHYGVSL